MTGAAKASSPSGSPSIEPLVDSFDMRVSLADTDAAGVVYMTAPATWSQIGFENLLRMAGYPLETVLPRDLHYPIVSVKIDHSSPLTLGRPITVRTAVTRVGQRSVEFTTVVVDRENNIAACTITRVGVARSRSGRVVEAEPWLREIACVQGELTRGPELRRRGVEGAQ